MAHDAGSLEQFSRQIFDLAMDRDSDDNLSVIALRLHELDSQVPAPEKAFSLKSLNPFNRFKKNANHGNPA